MRKSRSDKVKELFEEETPERTKQHHVSSSSTRMGPQVSGGGNRLVGSEGSFTVTEEDSGEEEEVEEDEESVDKPEDETKPDYPTLEIGGKYKFKVCEKPGGYQNFGIRMWQDELCFQVMSSSMQRYKSLGLMYPISQSVLGEASQGLMCCVHEPDTSNWFRSKIVKPVDNKVVLKLLDAGVTVLVTRQLIYEIQSHLHSPGPLGVRCCLPVVPKPKFAEMETAILMRLNETPCVSLIVRSIDYQDGEYVHLVDFYMEEEATTLVEALLAIGAVRFSRSCSKDLKAQYKLGYRPQNGARFDDGRMDWLSLNSRLRNINFPVDETDGVATWPWRRYYQALFYEFDEIMEVSGRTLLLMSEFVGSQQIVELLGLDEVEIMVIARFLRKDGKVVLFGLPKHDRVIRGIRAVQMQMQQFISRVANTELSPNEAKNYPFMMCVQRSQGFHGERHDPHRLCIRHRCFYRNGYLACVDCFWVSQDLKKYQFYRLPSDFTVPPPMSLAVKVACDMSACEEDPQKYIDEELFPSGISKMVRITSDIPVVKDCVPIYDAELLD